MRPSVRAEKYIYLTLAHKRKPKFFYFGYSLVRRFYCKVNNNGTDGQTDGQTECDAICGPLLGRRAAVFLVLVLILAGLVLGLGLEGSVLGL